MGAASQFLGGGSGTIPVEVFIVGMEAVVVLVTSVRYLVVEVVDK